MDVFQTKKITEKTLRNKQTLRKERGPWLFRVPDSAPSTTNFTVGDASKPFWPDQFMALIHLKFPAKSTPQLISFFNTKPMFLR